jgi:hypothetical protein
MINTIAAIAAKALKSCEIKTDLWEFLVVVAIFGRKKGRILKFKLVAKVHARIHSQVLLARIGIAHGDTIGLRNQENSCNV